MSIDDELLRQQAEEDAQKEQAKDKLGSQFEGGGNGHDKEESETPNADEELNYYTDQGEYEVDNTKKIFDSSQLINPSVDLDPYIQDRDYAEYIIDTAKKTVKQEDALVRQIVYVGLSKDTNNPLNLAVLAPTSEGKTYAVLETLHYFPKQDLWKIGSMSPKVIIRQSGILVDSNNEPLEGKIKELKTEIRVCQRQQKNDYNREEDLLEQLRQLYQEAKVLIDLAGKLFVFLEPPHPDTWSILKPILSHDDYEIEHPYVYEIEGMGFKVKKVVTRGWPACIFCSAKDESKWPVWPEIQSRFLITSPNMSSQKYLEGNILTAQKMGLPRLIQQSLIISDKEIELAKKCVLYIIQKIKNFAAGTNRTNPDPVWIPYSQILAHVLPAEKGTDNRISKRVFSFLKIITLSRSHLRGRLQYGAENLVIANLEEDLHEVLHITQNVSGIPPYKLKVFKEIFLEKYKTKKSPDRNLIKEERIAAVTTRELCDYYKEKTGKTITSNNLKQNYLNEFINNGLIDEEDSVIDNRQKIYHPIVDLPDDRKEDGISQSDQKISFLSISDRMDNILQHPLLLVPKRFKYIPKNWLELEILDLLRYPSVIERFELYNQENERLCICRFVELYQKAQMIEGYFSNALFYNSYNKIFGLLENIDGNAAPQCKNISIDVKMDNNDILDGNDNEIGLRAVRNNIAYTQIIRNNHLYQDFVDGSISDPSTNNEVRDAKQLV